MKHALVFAALLMSGFLRADDDLSNSDSGNATPPAPMAAGLQDEIPLGSKNFEKDHPASYDLPALPAKPGLVPVFRAHIYLDTPTAGGFNAHAQIRLNGSILTRHMPDGSERLLLRSPSFYYQKDAYTVFAPSALQGDQLNTMFAPDASSADEMTSDHQGATYLLNISDLARGVDNNVLEVVGNATATELGMGHVEDATIGWLDAKLIAGSGQGGATRAMPTLQIARDGIVLGAGKGGGMAIDFGGDRLCVETSDDMGEKNLLTLDDASTNESIRVANTTPNRQDLEQDIRWPDGLTLHRSFKLGDRQHIVWTEKWTNSTDDDMAIPFKDRLFLSGKSPTSIFLGGNPDAGAQSVCSQNPTVFIGDAAAKVGFGWTAEDDWLRNLMQSSRDSAGGNVFSRNFMLEGHKSITFEMSIQPLKSASYWDFINDLRERWGVNSVMITRAVFWNLVEPKQKGEGGWDGSPATALATEVSNKGPLYAAISPWLGLEPDSNEAMAIDAKTNGDAPSGDMIHQFYQYQHRGAAMQAMETTAATLRKQPGVKVMVIMHPSMEVAYLPSLDDYPFHNELLLGREGAPFQDSGYSQSWLKDAAHHGWAVVYVAPKTGSQFTKELARRIGEAIDTYKADAIYSDEFTFVGASRGYSRYDYRQGDGYSAILDDDGKIAAKVTDLGVATVDNQLAMIQAAKQRGKPMLVNSGPATRAVQNAGIWHFVEGGNGYWVGATMNLTTPLVLGNISLPGSQADVMKFSIALLQVGNLQVPSSANLDVQGADNFIVRQFPITPNRIGAGFVMGPERIVTAVSTDFEWPGHGKSVTIYRYSSNGDLLGKQASMLEDENHFRANVPPGGLLIVERN